MSLTKGFICYNCGFVVQNPDKLEAKVLYQCEECNAVTSISNETPKCGQCDSNNVLQDKNTQPLFTCPQCNSDEFA